MLQFSFLVFLIYSANIISGLEISLSIADPADDLKNCEDADCLKTCAKRTYDEFVTGAVEGVPSSDPLFIDSMVGDLPHLKFIAFNATFSGLKDCTPELVRFKPDLSSEYHLACKHLVLAGEYITRGTVLSEFIEGTGEFKIFYHDYVYLFNIRFTRTVDEKNVKHIHIKDYDIDVDPRGKIVFDYKNLYSGDSEKSAKIHRLANENWKPIEKVIRKSMVHKIMALYMNNVESYLQAVSAEHAYSCKG